MAAFKIAIASVIFLEMEALVCRVAIERIYTRGLLIEFIRILSPNKAPPVFLRLGSTEIMDKVFSGKSNIKRRTSSSVSEDFPAPPVPVIPKIGT